jgi:hypothetical protein
LFALADRYAAAYKKWGDSISLVDKMDAKAEPMPGILQWRDEDVALGLPDIRNSKLASRELAWDCEAFVGPLRNAKWTSCIKTGDDDDLTLHIRQLAPPPEARARADEIIVAFERWVTERAPRGYKKAQRRQPLQVIKDRKSYRLSARGRQGLQGGVCSHSKGN